MFCSDVRAPAALWLYAQAKLARGQRMTCSRRPTGPCVNGLAATAKTQMALRLSVPDS
jgi:hypothetical protein